MIDIREELLHSAVSHFPIAMFFLALMTKSAYYLTKSRFEELSANLNIVTKFLLFTAPLFYLVSIFYGDIAVDLIKNDICNLTLVYEHEQTAQFAVPFFLITIVLEVVLGLENFTKKNLRILTHIGLYLMLATGNFFMFKAAHQGGEMVYNHGVAVKNYKCPTR
jgi:uncharacterized membrane protein